MTEVADTPVAGVKPASTNDHPSSTKNPWRGIVLLCAVVFLTSYVFLFLGMTRLPNIYDEGIVLTDAMRVTAGQVPHRDFYVNYGPAQFYVLAGLFKLLGQSLIVERLYDLFLKSLIVTAAFAITSVYCRRSIALGAAIVSTAWVFSIRVTGTAMVPVSLLGLIAAILLAPVFARRLSAKRLFVAGVIAGLAALFRYELGAGLLGIGTFVLALAAFLAPGGLSIKARTFLSTYWPYLAGFAVLTVPAALYYLSVAPIQPWIHDAIIYPAKYYPRTRSLPFPRIRWSRLDNLDVYLPIVVVVISLCGLIVRASKARRDDSRHAEIGAGFEDWEATLFTFMLLALLMYVKGFVRFDRMQMFAAIISSVPLLAILLGRRSDFPRAIRISIAIVACLFVLSAVRSTWIQSKNLYLQRLSVLEELIPSARKVPDAQAAWCQSKNPLTVGLCFLPEDYGIPATEFLVAHTRPGEPLYSGVTRHDKIFVNDMLVYFATQRLPASHWAHFDPGLQNSYEIQTQMVRELQEKAPPYILLMNNENWFDEPNDSGKSSGIRVLDQYIRSRYRPVANFSYASVWEGRH